MVGVQVTIDKFVVEYKNIPYSIFLRLYMMAANRYKTKKETYTRSYAHKVYINKCDGIYMYVYYQNIRETERCLHTLRVETRPEYYVHFKEILEMIAEQASQIEFVSCDVAYDIQKGLEDIVVIPVDARRTMSHYKTTRYFGKPEQRKQNGYCRIYDKRLELEQNQGTYITDDLSRIEIVYKVSEEILLNDIVKYPPKQNKYYYAAVVTDWEALKKKQMERVINLRDGTEAYTQYVRREIKKNLTNQYRVDFDELIRMNWEKLIQETCSIILGVA
ncbi:replication initiation protein [Bacillus paranthracis]|uniref:replication initiation protein n=1 Tax=Bacillus paranthracis TaxID=2026186 RepID=UPI001F0EE1CF|nr:replication initiation protein [Bacillus paranthracis]MCH5439016.1 replication initiation protein [Bacillus paranthracis]